MKNIGIKMKKPLINQKTKLSVKGQQSLRSYFRMKIIFEIA